jgi:CBS domain containing-hemolysin-like protein
MKREIGFNLLLCLLLTSSVVFSMASLRYTSFLETRISALQEQVQDAEESAKLREAEAREDVKATYQLLTGMASRWRLTSNMQVRAYHYISSHEGTHVGCPECFDILRRNGEAIPFKPEE